MSNPSVTASITVDDKATPRLRELVELSQRLSRVVKDAQNDAGGNRYASNLRMATAAAREHLNVMERMHKVQSAVAATAVGVAGAKALQIAKHAVVDYLPYERNVRYQKAIQGYSDADMGLLEHQRVNAATVYGLKPEDTLHAQQAFVTRNFNAQITEAGTKQAIILSKALNVPAEQAAKIVEGITFAGGDHLRTPDDARRKIAQNTDIAAIAAKAGSMTPEDLSQFAKFGIGMTTAAGIGRDQAFAAAMTLRRANVSGDESGVFMRQLSARLLAPTKQAYEAFAHMGIDYNQYATQGNVSPDAIDASLRRRYGKGLSDEGKASLSNAFNDESRNVLGSREDFASAVREAVEAAGEKLSRTDEKHLVDTALRQYDLAKGGLRGGDLFNDILNKATPKDLQALVGDKQGGRAVMLLNALDQYREYLEKLGHGDGYAEKIANERMEGLAAAVDRLTASTDTASKQMVAANQSWLTPLANAAGKVVASFTGISDRTKEALSVSAGIASLAGLSAAGATVVSVIGSLTGLAASANVASVSLARIAAGGAAGTAASAAGTVAGGAAAGAGVSRLAGGLRTVSKGLGWAAVAAVIGPELYDLTGREAAGTDDAKGGGAANYRRRLARLANERMHQSELEDLVAGQAGPFDKYQPDTWHARRSVTRQYLRDLGITDDAPVSREGWQDSAKVNVKQVDGANKWGEVTGTVTGTAELHQNLTIELRPSAYLESIVQRAESASAINLNGKLGTGLQGPGDNSVKPVAAPVGTQ